MKLLELKNELDFIRSKMNEFSEAIARVEKGERYAIMAQDNDRIILYNSYHKIVSEMKSMLRHQYDVEDRGQLQ